jgi:DNA polymerase-3 subunit delta
MAVVHAIDVLTDGAPSPIPHWVLMSGSERAWRLWTLDALRSALSADADHVQMSGDGLEPRSLRDELDTVSLFASDSPRLVIVRDADPFVEKNRQALERLIEAHGGVGGATICVLDANSVAANTRVYKLCAEHGLVIDARIPTEGKSARVDQGRLSRFIVGWLAPRHALKLDGSAAAALLELVGPNLAAIDSSLAKLALYPLPSGQKVVTSSQVEQIVGGWRNKTVWQVIDAVADGEAGEALRQLDHLLASGEDPLGLLPQLSWALRRLGVATQLYQQLEDRGEKASLTQCLQRAGVKSFPGELAKCERQLKRLGRHRASRLLDRLLSADLKLKGTHSNEHRARWVLEELILSLAVDGR